MESHIGGITGSLSEPFYDLLHPSSASNNSPNNNSHSSGFIKQMDELGLDKDMVLPSYNSQPLKTSFGSSNSSSGVADLPHPAPMPTYSSMVHSTSEHREPLQTKLQHDRERFEAATMAAIERTVKKHGDNLLRALEGISGRLAQMENKTQHLEASMEELKMSVGKSHGETDGRMRLLENLLREVQTGVQILRDKQEIAEARSELLKSQPSKYEFSDSTAARQILDSKPVDSQQPAEFTAPQHPTPSFSFPSQSQTSISASIPNLPGPLLSQQPGTSPPFPVPQPQQSGTSPPFPIPQAQQSGSSPPFPIPQPQQSGTSPPFPIPQTQQSAPGHAHAPPLGPHPTLHLTPSVPSEPSYQSANHQSSAPPPPSQPHQYQGSSQMQQAPPNAMQMPSYSQNPQPQLPSGQPVSIPYSQPEPSPIPQHIPHPQMPTSTPPVNYGPEPPYMPLNYGAPTSHQQPRPMSSSQMPASPQNYNAAQQAYEPSFGRSSSGPLPYPTPYGSALPGPTYGDSQSYSAPPFRLHQQDSTPTAGSGHPRLPTAKPLQHSLPLASSVSGSPSSSTSSNRVPVDDVVDKVSSMGFSRDQVKAVVRKLTENGQSVDLNIVLDKLMNGGDIQPQKGWFGR